MRCHLEQRDASTLAGPHINLAEHYRATGQNDKSERAYAEAIAISPDHADLRYGHALSLVREKAMAEAVRELNEAIRLDPGNARYKTTLAIALDSLGRTEDAFDCSVAQLRVESLTPICSVPQSTMD